MKLVAIVTGVKIIVAIGAVKRRTVGGSTGRSTDRHGCSRLVDGTKRTHRTLLLGLRHGGTGMANGGQGAHQEDLIMNGRKRLVKPHEKLHKLLSVILGA